MKKELRIGVSALAGSFLLATAICLLPPSATNAHAAKRAAHAQDAQQTQAVSGKIASVGKTSFTLAVKADHVSAQSQSAQGENATDTMKFQVNRNTTIDGTMQVGANADVTYREEGGNNIAISVRVTS
jgi:hypothetical protein